MCGQRVEHLVVGHRGFDGDFGDGRASPEPVGQRSRGARDHCMIVLEPQRHMYWPRLVAKMAADLAKDRRLGERLEVRTLAPVKAIDGLDEADHRDLLKVV